MIIASKYVNYHREHRDMQIINHRNHRDIMDKLLFIEKAFVPSVFLSQCPLW